MNVAIVKTIPTAIIVTKVNQFYMQNILIKHTPNGTYHQLQGVQNIPMFAGAGPWHDKSPFVRYTTLSSRIVTLVICTILIREEGSMYIEGFRVPT